MADDPTEDLADPEAADRRVLAGSDVAIGPLGVGTWAWGDKATWGMGGYDADLTRTSIQEAWDASLDAGVALFDTAEVYGDGESERIIGELLAGTDPERRSQVVLATKFMPFPWKVRLGHDLRASLLGSLERLGVDAVDLYQIHGPISLRGHGAMADALATVHADGLVRAVGVSNYNETELRRIDAQLRSRGLRVATNQIEYSLLRTRPETTGLLDACAELGVVVLAYSPIGQGRLTGKYSAANPPPGRRTFSTHPMAEVDAIVDVARRIGDAHGGATPSQVALAWLVAKGAVPIPGAKSRAQAEGNAGCLGWALSADDVAALDGVARYGTRTLAQRFWQHG
jgi:aryl-alcohol dehydrogenase-like predicted oxidoreductase